MVHPRVKEPSRWSPLRCLEKPHFQQGADKRKSFPTPTRPQPRGEELGLSKAISRNNNPSSSVVLLRSSCRAACSRRQAAVGNAHLMTAHFKAVFFRNLIGYSVFLGISCLSLIIYLASR